MDTSFSMELQPRIDMLVTDAVSGAQRRRTEYAGAAWFGDKPQLTGFGMVSRTRVVKVDEPFFLPDSLPYRSDLTASAVLVVSVSVQSTPAESQDVMECRAALVPDPRNPAVSWIQVQLLAWIHTPTAISYRVDVLVPPEAVLGDRPAG
jgi:hypothetical protein